MKIRVNNTELKVSNFYPFRYPNGKLVLRFNVDKNDADFTTLYDLLNNVESPIEYFDNDEASEPVCTYYKYTEFTANYTGSKFEVEQVTPSTLDSAVEALQAKIETQNDVINKQNEVIQSQEETIAMLSECVLEMSTVVYE